MVHSTAPDTAKAELFDSLALEGFQASPLLTRLEDSSLAGETTSSSAIASDSSSSLTSFTSEDMSSLEASEGYSFDSSAEQSSLMEGSAGLLGWRQSQENTSGCFSPSGNPRFLEPAHNISRTCE